MSDPQPLVSVLVATCNRADDVAKSLPSLLANDYPNFEVIVVDQSDDDRTRERVAAIADERVVYVYQREKGASRALNTGIRRSRGAILAEADDDCHYPSDWIRGSVALLTAHPEVGVLFGPLVAVEHDKRKVFIPDYLPTRQIRFRGRTGRRTVIGKGIASANLLVRREVFERLNGFDEQMGPGARIGSGEDTDLAYRALRAGFVVLVDPSMPVYHWGSRPYTDGSAQGLLRNVFFTDGALLMKQIRGGDAIALWVLIRRLARQAGAAPVNLARTGRPTGGLRFAYLLRGAYRGARLPLDREFRQFRPTTGLRNETPEGGLQPGVAL